MNIVFPTTFRMPDVSEPSLCGFIIAAREWAKTGRYKFRPMPHDVYQRNVGESARKSLYNVRSAINSGLFTFADFQMWVILQFARGKYPAYSNLPWDPKPYLDARRVFSAECVKEDAMVFAEIHKINAKSGITLFQKYKLPLSYYVPYTSDGHSLMWLLTNGTPVDKGRTQEERSINQGFYLRGLVDIRASKEITSVAADELIFRERLFLAVQVGVFLAKLYPVMEKSTTNPVMEQSTTNNPQTHKPTNPQTHKPKVLS